jgi:hypothetical protein
MRLFFGPQHPLQLLDVSVYMSDCAALGCVINGRSSTEIFVAEFCTQTKPVWVGDLESTVLYTKQF